MTDARPSRFWMFVCVALLAIAALQRVWNLVHYPIGMGFDADGNWEYILMLIGDWRIPAPGEGWSTAHPPFFYALGAAIGRLLGTQDMELVGHTLIASCSLLGLASVVAIAVYLRDCASGNGRRIAIALAVLLFLPVHVYMSPMLGEEMLATAFVTFAVVALARELGRPLARRSDLLRPALIGVVAGLGLLTKMSAVMLVVAGTVVLFAEGPRRGWIAALRSTAAFAAAAALVGGWYYVRNALIAGDPYPHRLPVHDLLHGMPPGYREVVDYVRFPLAAFGPAQASDPQLLHSIWGSVWASIWFDSHRGFVPLHPTTGLAYAAHILLVLGLVPAFAFVAGLARGVRRALRDGSGPDRLFVALTVLLVAGLVAFTWRDPYFASIKGSYLLGLSAPFAIYASETLHDWTHGHPWRARALGAVLGAICVVTIVTFSYDAKFQKREYPGTEWQKVPREHWPGKPATTESGTME